MNVALYFIINFTKILEHEKEGEAVDEEEDQLNHHPEQGLALNLDRLVVVRYKEILIE